MTIIHPFSHPAANGCNVDLRELKGLEIAARSKIVFADGSWLVPSQSSPGTKSRVTQNWPLYDQAQMAEKHRFQELLFDLTRGLADSPRAKTGRPATPMADMVFAAAFKVFSTFSARRFGCDLKDAHEKGYLSMLMNPRSISAYLESEELTVVLQALIVRSSLPLKTVETVFAPDSTGFSTSRFVRWNDEKYGT